MLVDARPSIEKHRNCGKMGVIGLCVALTNRVREFDFLLFFFLISLFPEVSRKVVIDEQNFLCVYNNIIL